MLPQLVMNANLVETLKGLGKDVTDTLFRPSGWDIPDDTDTGISFEAAVGGGFGYMEMDVKDIRASGTKKTYEIRGGYALKNPLIYQTGPKRSAKSGCSRSIWEKRCISGPSQSSRIVGNRS